MPLRMPCTTAARARSSPSSPMPTSGVMISRGIGRRDRGDAVGELQAGLQIADAAEIFDAVDAQARGGRPSVPKIEAGKWPWNARLCTVITVPGAAAAVMQIGGQQRRLPVVRVHDFRPRRPATRRADIGADARQGGEAPGVVGPVVPVGSEVRIARPVRTDAARRARTDRGPAAVPAQQPRRAAEQIGDRRAPAPRRRARRAPPDSRGPGCAPRRLRAPARRGSAPTTSASPPVLTSG